MKPVARLLLLCLLGLVVSSSAALAQAPAEPQPATAPARQRYIAQPPPGFERVEIEGRTFFLDPADREWVTQAMQTAGPTTMPTTMPADLIERVESSHADLARRLAADLALDDPAPLEASFRDNLLPLLGKLDELRPPLIYLVITPQRLKDVMRAGWTNPDYYYNRAADDVEFSTMLNLSLDADADEEVRPLFYDEPWTAEQRQQGLAASAQQLEAGILNTISNRSQDLVIGALVEMIDVNVFQKLSLPRDQEWFALGTIGYFSSKYASELTGLDQQRLLDVMSLVDPRNPIRPWSINLLQPASVEDMRAEFVPMYGQAMRARAVHAVRRLVEQAGEQVLPRSISAIRSNPPTDGKALLSLIQQIAGVDISPELAAR